MEEEVLSFEWDQGNKDKNELKHNVSNKECEEVFINQPYIYPNSKHSDKEERMFALGETKRSGCFIFLLQ